MIRFFVQKVQKILTKEEKSFIMDFVNKNLGRGAGCMSNFPRGYGNGRGDERAACRSFFSFPRREAGVLQNMLHTVIFLPKNGALPCFLLWIDHDLWKTTVQCRGFLFCKKMSHRFVQKVKNK